MFGLVRVLLMLLTQQVFRLDDTTEVSGEFSLENGDFCVLTLSVIDSSKIGLTEKICTD